MVKIYSQGDLNGACFLYSIANAYKALANKDITPPAWSEAVKEVFFLEDFMDGKLGTERYNDNPLLFETVINNMLANFSDKILFEIKHIKCSNLESVRKLISKKSVAIFCYKEKNGRNTINHWTCGVDINDDPFGIQVACSSCAAEPEKGDKFYRWYNETLSNKNPTEVFEVSVFRISIKS